MFETVTVVDSTYPDFRALVTQAYNQIILPNFENKELDSIEQLIDILDGKIPEMRTAISIIGENLDDPVRRKLHGIAVDYYYPQRNSVHMAYVAKHPKSTAHGLAETLRDAQRMAMQNFATEQGVDARPTILETHDPRLGRDAMATRRVAYFNRLGARELAKDIDWVQPPVNEGEESCDDYMLMSYPDADGKYAGPDDALALLESLYEYSYGYGFQDQPDFKHSKRLIDAWEAAIAKPARKPAARKEAFSFALQPMLA